MKAFLFVVSCVVLVSAFDLTSVEAASTYKVTPRVIDREVSQRDIFTEVITIENTSPHKITIFPSVNEIALSEGGDITAFTEVAATKDKSSAITTWITLSRAPLELAPGEVAELPASFRIHQEAPAGNYQALLGFGTGRNRSIAEKQVRDGQAPGVIVTLAVDQDQVESLRLGRFTIDKFVTQAENQAIQYTLANPGETNVTPKGEIILYNNRGDEVGSVAVNPENLTLTPGQETKLTAPAPVDGFLGKYKAFLTIDYGTEQAASVYDTVYFYVVPWQKLLMVFGAVLVVTLVLTLLLVRRNTGEDYDDDEHGADYLPLHIVDGVSKDEDHDINLKK